MQIIMPDTFIVRADIRSKEMKALHNSANTRALSLAVLFAAPSFVAVFTLGIYALLGNKLTPPKIFTALSLFNQLRFPLLFLPLLFNSLAEGRLGAHFAHEEYDDLPLLGKVSLTRITNFLLEEELVNYVKTPSSPLEAGNSRNSIMLKTCALALSHKVINNQMIL
jgi:hypothetical protein